MGDMRFIVDPPGLIQDCPEAYRAYLSGADGRVFPTRVEINGKLMVCRRESGESGKLHVAWPIPGHGRPVICTTSLAEREEPYLLAVELARGQISVVRDQLAAWEIEGAIVPDEFHEINRAAYQLFSQAAASQNDSAEASRLACDSLAKAYEAAELLSLWYSKQQLDVRRRRSHHLPVLLGCSLGQGMPDAAWETRFCEAFNAASVPVSWNSIEPTQGKYEWAINDAQVEWCEKNKLLMYGGSLLDFAPKGLPQWLWQWEHDFLSLQSFISDFVETAVSRYAGRIRLWEVAARANTGGELALSEENRLTLVARSLEAARQIDEEIQLTLRVDQPWGDYQARGQHRFSPIQFVDALVRSGVGLSGVNLEISIGYQPRGSGSRGLLDFSRLVDVWSSLGIPLHVTLAFPSSSGTDSQANSDLEVDSDQWKQPWSEAAQAEWIELYLPVLMAHEEVLGIYWSYFCDKTPHNFPHAGLLRLDGTAKPGLDHIIKYRRAYWESDSNE